MNLWIFFCEIERRMRLQVKIMQQCTQNYSPGERKVENKFVKSRTRLFLIVTKIHKLFKKHYKVSLCEKLFCEFVNDDK